MTSLKLHGHDMLHIRSNPLSSGSQACFIVDSELRLLFADMSVGNILGEASGIFLEGGILRLKKNSERHLRQAVCRSCGNESHEPELLVVENEGARLLLCISPASAEYEPGLARITATNAFSRDPRVQRCLSQLFGLSKAEASIAVRISYGESLNEIASARGAAVGTIRVQVKGIARKMGVHRQVEIAIFVTSINPLLPEV